MPPILDPPRVRKKEVTNAKIKSKLETKKRKKVKGVSTSKAPQASSTVHGMFKINNVSLKVLIPINWLINPRIFM